VRGVHGWWNVLRLFEKTCERYRVHGWWNVLRLFEKTCERYRVHGWWIGLETV
jgi:hypothetical protein